MRICRLATTSVLAFAVAASGCGKKSDGDKAADKAVDDGKNEGEDPGPGDKPAAISGTVELASFPDGAAPESAILLDASGFTGGTVVSQAPVPTTGVLALDIPPSAQLQDDSGTFATVLVALTSESLDTLPSEDSTLEERLAVADSFRFVSMPLGAEGVVGLPVGAAQDGVALGQVSGAGGGDEARAATEASTDVFHLPGETLAQWARGDNGTKATRNDYVNNGRFRASPFFLWRTEGLAKVRNATSAPEDAVYSGYGFYVSVSDDSVLGFDSVCGVGGQPQKMLELVPPAAVAVRLDPGAAAETQLGPDAPFNNASPSETTQNGSRVCHGSATGFYFREDNFEGRKSFMANWGTGGSIQGAVPAGDWTLKFDGTAIASFDLESAKPVDANGHAVVYVPSVTVTTKVVEGVAVHDRIAVNFLYWDDATNAWVRIADPTIFDSLATKPILSIGIGPDERRFEMAASSDGDLFVVTGTALTMDGSNVALSSIDVASASSYATGYEIGRTSFRFETR